MQNAKNIKPLFGGKNQWEGKGWKDKVKRSTMTKVLYTHVWKQNNETC
jgi:hypothetical protein